MDEILAVKNISYQYHDTIPALVDVSLGLLPGGQDSRPPAQESYHGTGS